MLIIDFTLLTSTSNIITYSYIEKIRNMCNVLICQVKYYNNIFITKNNSEFSDFQKLIS